METLNIAVAGCGLIGKEHIKRIQTNSRTNLFAVVDPTEEGAAHAVKLGSRHFSSLDEMFANEIPDGVILATPNQMHYSQALKCIEVGTAILIEKPVSDNLRDAEDICKVVESTQAKVLVGHHRAHSTIMTQAVEAINEGLIGKIVAVQGSATFYKPDWYFDEAPWRKTVGGGPILINLIHEIGNFRSLCGEIVALEAMISSATRGFPVEDTAAIIFRFSNGALGTFLLSDTAGSAKSWEQTSQENPSYSTYPDEDCYVILGTNGSLSVPTMRLKRFSEFTERSWWKELECTALEINREDPLTLQLSHFCDVIEGKADPLVSAFDGMQNMKVLDAIQRSVQSGGLVEIE